jgi:TonB family protein
MSLQLRLVLCFVFLCTSVLLPSQAMAYKKHGRNVVHNEDGTVSVGRTKNYLREGKWYESYPDHQKKSFGRYHLGLAEGRHFAYWPNGNISSIRDYTGGKHNGHWITFNASGDTIEHLNFGMDVLQGYFMTYDTLQDEKIWGTNIDGKKSGWYVYKSNIITDSCEYQNGVRNGQRNHTAIDGSRYISWFRNDQLDSVALQYSNGKLESEYWYSMGKPCKTSKVFWPAGSDTVLIETWYASPGKIESYIKRFPNGQLQKKEWYSDQHLDSITEYFMNGNVKCRYIYRQREFGFRQIVHQYQGYDSTGHKIYVHYNNRNGLDSVHRYYSTSGSVLRELEYINGSIVGEKYFYPDGKSMLHFSTGKITAFSEAGNELRPGSAAYSAIFSKLDSLESSAPDYLPFPPVVAGHTVDPELLAIDLETPVLYADEVPEFPGGSDSLRLYLNEHIRYPEIDMEMGNEGTVYVQFVVEKNGMITNVKVARGASGAKGLDAEAVRVVSGMPKWSPGYLRGVPVRYQMTLPVRFQLK